MLYHYCLNQIVYYLHHYFLYCFKNSVELQIIILILSLNFMKMLSLYSHVLLLLIFSQCSVDLLLHHEQLVPLVFFLRGLFFFCRNRTIHHHYASLFNSLQKFALHFSTNHLIHSILIVFFQNLLYYFPSFHLILLFYIFQIQISVQTFFIIFLLKANFVLNLSSQDYLIISIPHSGLIVKNSQNFIKFKIIIYSHLKMKTIQLLRIIFNYTYYYY